jgi:hypothetical protein
MNKLRNVIAGSFLMLLIMVGCKDDKRHFKGDAVARYKQQYLYEGELTYHLPKGLKGEDSIRLAKKYVDNWLTARAIEDKAHTVLPNLDQEIMNKLEVYRSRLIEHEYMDYVIENELYSTISDRELDSYYEKNKERFTSKADFYSFFYVSSKDSFDPRLIASIRSRDENMLQELVDWCSQHEDIEYKLDSTYATETELEMISKGFPLNIKRVPLNQVYTYDYADPSTGNITHHLFKMLGKVKEGEQKPLMMSKDEIRAIIINQRKRKLMDQTKKWLLDQAKMNRDVAIF